MDPTPTGEAGLLVQSMPHGAQDTAKECASLGCSKGQCFQMMWWVSQLRRKPDVGSHLVPTGKTAAQV